MPDPASRKRPFAAWFLLALLTFQAGGALFGGALLVIAPSGALLKMPLSSLDGTPFSDYRFPGLVLFFVLGVFPLFTAYALLRRPQIRWPEWLNIYRNQYWGWSFAVYTGILLVGWILIQGQLIGFGSMLQGIYLVLGAVILITAVLPAVKRYYYRW
jgi:hypothetical protein